ncbi:MAG: hypothetical protein R3F14_20160 [Polyangiaceae bacterium]
MKIAGLVRAGFLSVGMSGMALGCMATLDAADPPDVGDDPRGLPARAHFQVGTCGVDEMRERVCGSLAEPVDVAADGPFWDCPADPRRLTAAGPAMMFYADTKEMEFDRRMTLRYRRERAAACSVVDRRGAADDEEQASAEERLKGECCFSRCTPLPAGTEVGARDPLGVPRDVDVRRRAGGDAASGEGVRGVSERARVRVGRCRTTCGSVRRGGHAQDAGGAEEFDVFR